MVCLRLGVSRSKYVTTRTRGHFVGDMRAALSFTLLPLEVAASALFGDEDKAKAPQVQPDSDSPPDAPPPKAGDVAGHEARSRRARKSSRLYGWYRSQAGSNYRVHNLDTQDPKEWKQTTGVLGKVLDTRSRPGTR